MSGFLTRIAARSVAAAALPAVRPRPLSLFEPARQEPGLEHREVPPEQEPRRDAPAEKGNRPSPPAAVHDEPRPERADAGERDPPAVPEPRSEAALVVPRSDDRPPLEPADPPSEAEPVEVESPVQPEAPDEILVRTELVEVPVVARPRATSSAQPRASAPDPQPENGAPLRLDPQPEPRLVSAVPREQVLRLDRSSEPAEPRRAGSRPQPFATRTTRRAADPARGFPTGAEPEVHVTIGRVEIRAVQEAPAARQSPARSSRPAGMSLGEYLHRRAREGAQ